MRRRRWISTFAIFGIALLLTIYGQQSEPRYQDRPLTFWLRGFESDLPQTRWQSAEAIRRIGTNALPVVIRQLQKKPPTQESWLRQKFRSVLALAKINLPRPAIERREALAAIDALGPTAKNAVPALERLLHETPPDPQALLVLARIGSDGVPALTRALTNDEKVIRYGARACLDMQQSHSEVVFPTTLQNAEFMRRTCEFNSAILKAATEDYRRDHPEQFLPDGMPQQSLPPDFTPPKIIYTNATPKIVPNVRPDYE
jgi:hypothetical protein